MTTLKSRHAAADCSRWKPKEKWLHDAQKGQSKSANSPWSGQTLTARVKHTIVGGKVVFENGKIR